VAKKKYSLERPFLKEWRELLRVKDLSFNDSPQKYINVLCLYPSAMMKSRDETAFTLIRMREIGARLAVIAVRFLVSRGTGKLLNYEEMNGIPVHRLYNNLKETFLFPQKRLKRILRITEDLNPDLIFCVNELNMRLALLLKKYLKIPIVLRLEDAGSIFFDESYRTYRFTSRLKMKYAMRLLGIPSEGPRFWSWLCEKADALITCHPRDKPLLDLLSKHGKPVFYVPYPCHIPSDFETPLTRYKYRGIYAGSLQPVKNTQEFERTLPAILENTYTKEFVVVGPGPHASIIKKLQEKFGKAIRYIPQMPKNELLALISSSYYAYTPVKWGVGGGWGFIGDCWGTRTPIVMTHNDGYVVDGSNALVAQSEDGLVRNINRLYEDPKLYKNLQENGYQEYERRKADAIGDELYSIFIRTLDTCAHA